MQNDRNDRFFIVATTIVAIGFLLMITYAISKETELQAAGQKACIEARGDWTGHRCIFKDAAKKE